MSRYARGELIFIAFVAVALAGIVGVGIAVAL